MRPRKRARVTDRNCRWGERVPEAPEYNFTELVRFNAALRKYIKVEKNGHATVDFTSRDATLAITKSTMKLFFSLELNLPSNQLIPRIPSRVQYLRWAASLLPDSAQIRRHTVLDIGTGPSAIYPLLGVRLFPAWKFIGTDIDEKACSLARVMVRSNRLTDSIRITHTLPDAPLLQPEIWKNNEGEDTFDTPSIVVCNPPFFEISHTPASTAGTESQTQTEGGEVEFVKRIATESVNMPKIRIFTSLIGRGADVNLVRQALRSNEVRAKEIVDMKLANGTARSRWAVAWKFGPSKSVARVSSKKKRIQCELDAGIRVTPSRFHKNRTTPSAVLDAWCDALRQLGWKLHGEVQAGVGDGDIGVCLDSPDKTSSRDKDAMQVEANPENADKAEQETSRTNAEATQSEAIEANKGIEQQVGHTNTAPAEQETTVANANAVQEQTAGMVSNGDIGEDGNNDAEDDAVEEEPKKEYRAMSKCITSQRACVIEAAVGEPTSDGSFFLEMQVKETGGTTIFVCYDLAHEVCLHLGSCLDKSLESSP